MRRQFQEATDAFWREQTAADRCLSQGLLGPVRGSVRGKLGELAADLGRTSYLLLDAHRAYVLGILDDLVASSSSRQLTAETLQMNAIRDRRFSAYVVAFKTFFLFLRAYQDVAWVLIREVADSVKLRVGIGKGRMSQSFSCQTAAREHLFRSIPEYELWFRDWKALRDQVKSGVKFAICEPQSDPGVTFTATRDLPGGGLALGGAGDRVVRLRELTNALSMMKSLARTVRTAPPPSPG